MTGWKVRKDGTIVFTPELIESLVKRCAAHCGRQIRAKLESGRVYPDDVVQVVYTLNVDLPE